MLFSPRDEDYANVMEQIEMLNFPYPLYLDFGGSFMESNPDYRQILVSAVFFLTEIEDQFMSGILALVRS